MIVDGPCVMQLRCKSVLEDFVRRVVSHSRLVSLFADEGRMTESMKT